MLVSAQALIVTAVRRRRHGLGPGDRRRDPGSRSPRPCTPSSGTSSRHPGRGLRRRHHRVILWRPRACTGRVRDRCAGAARRRTVAPAPGPRRSASAAVVPRAPARPAAVAARCATCTCRVRRPQGGQDVSFRRGRARSSASSARTAPARPRCSTCSTASCGRRRHLLAGARSVGLKPHEVCAARRRPHLPGRARLPAHDRAGQRGGRRLRPRGDRRRGARRARDALARVGLPRSRAGDRAAAHDQAAAPDGAGARAGRQPRSCCSTRRWPASGRRGRSRMMLA